ncbi:Type IIB DNA topoisomerase [Aphelenchoides fujianensis]|nr:Type IIB DNA topoisomerase [Aphelenchoides fujianensis]
MDVDEQSEVSSIFDDEATIRWVQAAILDFLIGLKAATDKEEEDDDDTFTKTIVLESPVDKTQAIVFAASPKGVVRFARQLRTLVQVFTLLVNERRATKRDLFYEGKHLYGLQRRLDANVSKLCHFFSRARYELNVMSSGKGCVMGRMQLVNRYGKILNFDAAPITITEDLCDFEHLFIDAKFILVVEKDSLFRRLVDNGFFEYLPDVMLVTGRGFPDFNTRYFLRWILDMMNIPLFRPRRLRSPTVGYHIFMQYRYGNPKTVIESGEVLLPEAQLLGMTAAQVDELELQKLPLGEGDKKRIAWVKKRAEEVGDHVVKKEIESMEERDYKIQLEAWATVRPGYLIKHVLRPYFEVLHTCRNILDDMMDSIISPTRR